MSQKTFEDHSKNKIFAFGTYLFAQKHFGNLDFGVLDRLEPYSVVLGLLEGILGASWGGVGFVLGFFGLLVSCWDRLDGPGCDVAVNRIPRVDSK